ncbi:LysM peptidoglycan-binding domain-containing protein [Tissierella creatinini]|nr:LysM peptidoglycan-binding domain-containing protein [Tissierella creatinini]TJX61012.1 LysM peptidoglycan-binding domain-containing protein [Soehngenia saccharolytica]
MINENFEIDLLDSKNSEANTYRLPMHFETIGSIESDDLNVYINQNTLKEIIKYSKSDKTKELGGILIGEYSEELGKTNVIISDYIVAKYTDASKSTLTFTHESWDYINAERSSKFPDKKIVGWHHTHPNHGIFLSSYDMFIHENFFDLPFQVALVVDPIQDTNGFFQWKDGKVQKQEGYRVYDELNKKISVEAYQSSHREKDSKVSPWLIALLSMALIAGSIFYYFNYRKIYNNLMDLSNKVSMIEEQNLILSESNLEMQKQLDTTKDEFAHDYSSHEVSQLTEDTGDFVFRKYIVKKGDTLTSICNKFGINYNQASNLIQVLSSIETLDKIAEGQEIILPVRR